MRRYAALREGSVAGKRGAMTILVAILLLLVAAIAALVGFTVFTARNVEARLPPRGRFLEVFGERLHYVDSGGAGPALLMIHGLAGTLLHFDYALAGRLAGEFRVILVDRPGSGYSTRAYGADATVTAQAKAIAELIRALNLQRPLVVGHSLGGAVALALALDWPDCVGALALIAPLTHMQEEAPKMFRGLVIRSRLARELFAWTLATPLAMLVMSAALKAVFAPEAVAPDYAIRAGGLLCLRPQAFRAASSDLVAVPEALPAYIRRYGSLDIPVGMLFGNGDQVLSPRIHADAMKADFSALDLELIDGGHLLPLTEPERCVALIRRMAARMN